MGELICRNPECKKGNPIEAIYCMNCGKKLIANNNRGWAGEILEVTRNENFDSLVAAMHKKYPNSISEIGKVQRKEAIRAIKLMRSERDRQELIRKFGLDGQGSRTNKEIAEEIGVSHRSVNARINWAIAMFRNGIWHVRRSGEPNLLQMLQEASRNLNGQKSR